VDDNKRERERGGKTEARYLEKVKEGKRERKIKKQGEQKRNRSYI
jgi:hypothetical protein